MVKRYYEDDVKVETKTIEIFECPDCGFEFNAHHEVDEQVGGWECPLCEVEELQKEKKYWIESHKKHQKAIDVLKEIAIYEGDFYSNDMAVKARKALMELL